MRGFEWLLFFFFFNSLLVLLALQVSGSGTLYAEIQEVELLVLVFTIYEMEGSNNYLLILILYLNVIIYDKDFINKQTKAYELIYYCG